MPRPYANQQPEGFSNYIQKVAIVGASGSTGKFFTKHLLQTGKHTVTALSRAGSNNVYPDGTKVVQVDYNDEDSLVSALQGQDFLVITLAITAPEEVHRKLVTAAATAGVPYVMPNAHSINFWDSESFRNDLPVGALVLNRIQEVKDAGLKCISLMIGFWYEHSLAMGEGGFGIDIGKRTVVLFDDGKKAVNTSTWPLCGRALAALASLKKLPDDESDESVTLAHFQDRPAFVSSFKVSQNDILESIKRVTGTTDVDWSISHELTAERYSEGGKELQEGNPGGFYKQMYARVFYPSGDADYEPDNQLLGLLDDDLDEATRAGIELAKAGYSY
ncbi:CipA protein [Dactylonectria macrodidyma]|uniref:CipA protein n=1 Tax=Dactylonectria macrodidyma TaxID=307937 RepID=A0A9P9INF3_9HYPO|nr:CipA protein [Dactylonectria macrodidyma]